MENTRFLYSPQTTQDLMLVTDNTRFYSRCTTIDFYTRHGQRTILYLSQTTQDSILATNNPRFLYSLWTIQDFYSSHYTRNGDGKILYSSQTTQDSIHIIDNTRFYTRHKHNILYSSQTTQDSIPVTNNPRLLYSLRTIQDFYSRHYTRNGDDKDSILVADNTRFYTRHNTIFYTRHRKHKIL